MPAYSFQSQFIPFIERGEKTHTIRAKRKFRPKPGQIFYGYYAMRTKKCRQIILSTITKVQDIKIDKDGEIFIDGEQLSLDEMEQLASRDGFEDLYAMMEFWEGRLPFEGDIIHWKKA